MGVWSEYLATSHPHLMIDMVDMPDEMRELLDQHGYAEDPSPGAVTVQLTLGAMLESFCDSCRIWGYMDKPYMHKWRVTMQYLSRDLAADEPLWIMFLCRERETVYWLRWRKGSTDVAVESCRVA